AMGVDGAAHRGCLNGGGRTYAFLGCGVDIVYPRSHQKLYEEILEHGAIISEYPPGDPPLAEHFPVRNRLIAGISQKTIVVEARRRSGSLITADFAMEQGKDVLVLPGRITDVMSEGTNQLIAQGAGIIQSIDGLIADLKDFPDLGSVSSALKTNENLNLEKEELLVYSCLDFYAKSLEEIMQESGLSLLELLSALLRLCERGLAKETFKNQYIRLG
ncbi:MAG: DNA-protecting protein DprA, partial [Lachnospiraceae bacterium]|nr:DNA-protecting protein DprA [Lachnospiraceae bacterium]